MIESVSRPVAAIIVVLAVALFSACGMPSSRTMDASMAGTSVKATVDGIAKYHEETALPAGAFFEATIEDISQAGAPSTRVGRTVIDHPQRLAAVR